MNDDERRQGRMEAQLQHLLERMARLEDSGTRGRSISDERVVELRKHLDEAVAKIHDRISESDRHHEDRLSRSDREHELRMSVLRVTLAKWSGAAAAAGTLVGAGLVKLIFGPGG